MCEGLGFWLYQCCMNRGSVRCVTVFGLRWCGYCCREVGGYLGPGTGRVGWCYICVCCGSGLFVKMVCPGVCVSYSVDNCAS